MRTYSLYELNEYVRRVLALNFPEALWVSGEIAQVGVSRGHHFLSLVQKDEAGDQLIARSEAVVWAGAYRRLRRHIGRDFPSLLQEGIEVRLLARLDFNERYGLKLIVEDIDPTYAVGRMEQRRRAILQQLRDEALLERNRRQPLPVVLQRIAVLSSEQAAGRQDFLRQLDGNPYGYRFEHRLFPAAMQGSQVEPEVLKQLQAIEGQAHRFDCVVITRGGGARLDLSAFDSLALGRAIAAHPLPVLTGIGHDIDETVIDLVAHTALKTPTAAADFLIERNLQFEARINELGYQLQLLSQRRLHEEQQALLRAEQSLRLSSRRALQEQHHRLEQMAAQLPRLSRRPLREQERHLAQLEQVVALLSPEATLRRGYTLTLKAGRIVTGADQLQAGDSITTRFADGEVDSTIHSTKR